MDPNKQFFIFHLHSSKCDPFRQGININTIYENIVFRPVYKGNNKITELRTILQRESQNS